MYYHEGVFYLYYLITEHSPGEGVGCATSRDGVHFTDHGKVIEASENMEFYLGTGSVWKSPFFKQDGWFFCNYSEWRRDKNRLRQTIFFARSRDLLHWEKLGDKAAFFPDTVWYREYQDESARWDCIFPLQRQGGSYFGYWTASPKGSTGVGFGSSLDGVTWKAGPSPEINLGPFALEREVEAGAACYHQGVYYLMVGCYSHPDGVGIYTASSPEGPFHPQKDNFALFSNKSHIHAYFPRFVQHGEELLVNFHQIAREENGHGRFYTALSPLKRACFENGILWLKWWEQNECLRGAPLDHIEMDCILEGAMAPGDAWELALENGEKLRIARVNKEISQFKRVGGETEEEIQKTLQKGTSTQARLMVGRTLTELYIGDYFVTSYTLRSPLKRGDIPGGVRCWALDRDK